MKKHLATLLLAAVMGVLGFAVSGVAVAGVNDKPPSPPGQDECEHGNSAKPCKEDPQPDKGKDCEVHGNNGGVNEDHCTGDETIPTETTATDSGTSSPPPSTSSSEPGSTQAPESSATPAAEPSSNVDSSEQTAPTIVGTPPVAPAAKKQAAALGVTATAPKPTRQAQQSPLTL